MAAAGQRKRDQGKGSEVIAIKNNQEVAQGFKSTHL
jgi:hypothetical protein